MIRTLRRNAPLLLIATLAAGCAQPDGVRDPDANSRMRVAATAEASGQTDVALSMYGAAAAGDPNNAEAQARFAAALARAGNRAQAEQVLAAAVERRPNDNRLLLELGRMRLRSGSAGEALGLFDRILAREGRSVPALDGRGVALDLMGRHPEAQDSYRRAQAIAPDSVSVANNLGLSLLLDGRPDEARAVLEPLARRADANQRVTANYAISLAATGDEAAARTVLGAEEADLRGVAEVLRVNRQVIEVTPGRAELSPPAGRRRLPAAPEQRLVGRSLLTLRPAPESGAFRAAPVRSTEPRSGSLRPDAAALASA